MYLRPTNSENIAVEIGRFITALFQSPKQKSSDSSVPTAQARPHFCNSLSDFYLQRRARLKFLVDVPMKAQVNSGELVSSPRTRRPMRDYRSPNTSLWVPGSIPNGTPDLPTRESMISALIAVNAPAHSRVDSVPNSHSHSR